jgi:ComF family protein
MHFSLRSYSQYTSIKLLHVPSVSTVTVKNITNLLHLLGAGLLELIYPTRCVECGSFGAHICQNCYCEIDFQFLPIRIKLEPLYLDAFFAVAHHDGIIRALIHYLKYDGLYTLAKTVGDLLYIAGEWPDVDLVTSVPIHSKRRRERGFNQAELIAKRFSQLANLPYLETLRRIHNTAHQAEQSNLAARIHNIGADFEPLSTSSAVLRNKRVLLIDDVCTTGQTLNQCAAALKITGCNVVYGLTLAHGR